MKVCNFCAGVPAKIRKKFQEKYFKEYIKKINNFMKNAGTPAQGRKDKNVKK